jgi:hypothetical protein
MKQYCVGKNYRHFPKGREKYFLTLRIREKVLVGDKCDLLNFNNGVSAVYNTELSCDENGVPIVMYLGFRGPVNSPMIHTFLSGGIVYGIREDTFIQCGDELEEIK